MKHTPTPWEIKEGFREPFWIDAPNAGISICSMDWVTKSDNEMAIARANATFIVQAVNNHDRLVAENERLEKVLRGLADLEGKQLQGEDARIENRMGFQAGSAAAFKQVGQIARAALGKEEG